MDGQVYRDMEIRKLPPRYRTRIAQILDHGDDWKKLMSSIPSELNANVPKYKSEHVMLIERHAYASRRSCGDILMDEWGTSGRKRPTVDVLYKMLQECELFRAADYIAEEILEIGAPLRPTEGPAKRIEDELEPEVEALTKVRNENLIDLELSSSSGIGGEPPTLPLVTVMESERKNNTAIVPSGSSARGNLIDFSIATLKAATQDFDENFKIGTGSFGSVYKVELRSRGLTVAAKLLNQTSSMAEEQFLTEVSVLSSYRHHNLVSLIGYCTSGLQFCLVYEYLQGGNLMDALACEAPAKVLSWSERLEISRGILEGIHYLHSALDQPLIHRDIKSANVLLDHANNPKIGDFGLAKSFSNNGAQTSALASTIFGTSAYMAPEAFRGDISPKIDVFSFGVILLEIITALPPYDEDREGNDIVTFIEDSVEDDDILPWVDTKAGPVNAVCITHLYNIAKRCLTDKKKRPTCEGLLKDFKMLKLV